MRRGAVLLLAAFAAGCGGGGEEPVPRSGAEAPPAARQEGRDRSDARVREELGLPDRVPLRATGAAAFAHEDVVRRWMDELRRGEVERAAERFALPARFANLGPTTLIRTRGDALSITRSLPCGAEVKRVGGAAGYVVYEAELTERPGGDCGPGVGGRVVGAILVRDGRIAEWWRLPDRPRPAPSTAI